MEFVDVIWYEWLYKVSRDGIVISNKRTKIFKRKYLGKEYIQKQELPEKTMKIRNDDNGYPVIKISKNAKYRQCAISRLVYCSFNKIDLNDKRVVCHKNDNPKDSRLENLFIGTQKDNIHDCMKKWRRASKVGSKHHLTKINEEIVKQIKIKLKQWERMFKIAKSLWTSSGIVLAIRDGRSWTHVTI